MWTLRQVEFTLSIPSDLLIGTTQSLTLQQKIYAALEGDMDGSVQARRLGFALSILAEHSFEAVLRAGNQERERFSEEPTGSKRRRDGVEGGYTREDTGEAGEHRHVRLCLRTCVRLRMTRKGLMSEDNSSVLVRYGEHGASLCLRVSAHFQ